MLLGAASLALLALIVVNIQLGKTEKSTYSNVSLQDIEAMSTEFSFNGQDWNDTDTHSVGSFWFPDLHTCEESITTHWDFNPTILGNSLGSWGAYTKTVHIRGYKVTCKNGNGNCTNGTSCIEGNPI